MKKILLLLLTIICFQFVTAQKVTFGVKAGGNLASFNENFNSVFDYKYKAGFQIGGFARIELIDRLFLQPELLYSLQGAKYDVSLSQIILPQNPRGTDEFFENIENERVNESTLILPLMLKYYASEKLSIELGPQLDYIFHIKSNSLRFSEEGITSTDGSESVSDFNFGLSGGIGYDIQKDLRISFRYNYGFNRLFKGELANYDNGNKRRNSILSLNLEYRFN